MAKNIFKRFNNIKKKAGDGNPYALRVYMQFFELFGKDVDIINGFISKDDIDIVKFLEESNVKKTNTPNKKEDNSYNVKVEPKKGVEPIEGNPAKVVPINKSQTNPGAQQETSDDHNNDEHKIKVIKKFIAFANDLPRPITVWWRGMFNSNADLKKFSFSDGKDDAPKGMEKESDFVKNRYYNQQKYFSRKAGECKDAYYYNQKQIMFFSVVISVASVLSACVCNFLGDYKPEWLNRELSPLVANVISLGIAILSAATAYITSNDKLYQNLSFWIRYRVASEKLKSEYALYQGRCGDYNVPNNKVCKDGHTLAEKIFRKNVEVIVQEANDNFTKLLQNDNNPLNGSDITKSVAHASSTVAEDVLINEEEMKKKQKEKEELEKNIEKLKEEKKKLDEENQKLEEDLKKKKEKK